MLTAENLQFARQAGATHIVAHLVSYFSRSDELNTAGSLDEGWGVSVPEEERWTYEGLRDLRLLVEGEGLELAAIQNFEPAHWFDVLLDGPRKVEQLEKLATIVRNAGRAGVPTIGYNFSIAGVWGRTTGSSARGGAQSVGFNDPEDLPMPLGMVQNMIYDIELYRCAAGGAGLGEVSAEQMRSRLSEFLETLVPVARDAGVRLAMHPDDPPISRLRGTACVAWCPEQYEQAVDLVRVSAQRDGTVPRHRVGDAVRRRLRSGKSIRLRGPGRLCALQERARQGPALRRSVHRRRRRRYGPPTA